MEVVKTKNPKVSVLMPAYNAEKYVGEAIESILNQTFTDFEFIIIDDCSTDGTWATIQEYARKDNRIITSRNDVNSKICITLNKGIGLAKGTYIARMDADDWSYPDRLEKQVAFMDSHPEVVISGGTMEVCDEEMNILNERQYNQTDENIRKQLFRYSPFCHAATIYGANLARKINGYNPALSDAEDYDFYFRIGKFGSFGNLGSVLYKVRTHGGSTSQTKSRRQEVLTLYIRVKAVYEYGYPRRTGDLIYFYVQLASMFIVPQRFKFWVFNWLRTK